MTNVNKLKRKKTQKSDEKNDIYMKALETLNKPEDEFEHFGCTVAAKLRKMDAKQRIFTEHLINSALYLGQLGNLNEKYIITEPTYSQNVNSYVPVQFPQPAQQESPFNRQEIAANNPEVTQDDGFIQLQPPENGMSFRLHDYVRYLRDSKK